MENKQIAWRCMSVYSFKSIFNTLTKSTDWTTLNKDVEGLVGGQVDRVIAEGPIKIVGEAVKDSNVALFGKNGLHVVSDTKNVINGIVSMTFDSALNVFNVIPSMTRPPIFDEEAGSINAKPGKVIIDNTFHSEASIGDLSWLIYKAKTDTNPEITDKWKLCNSVETTSGYNSYTYANTKDKQVAITLEGTQPNSKLSPLWLSKDGLADLEIGLGVIPAQMREGYAKFKDMVADAVNAYVSKGYGISIAGHSLGGGLAQMMSGMYFIDTGVALPTVAEAGPGMLMQLKNYAEEQLLAGETIHLPTGGTYKLKSMTLLGKADEAKAVVSTFKAQQFSNVVNLITELDPVGHVNYSPDPNKDGHVGVNITVPYLLTAREDLQDVEYDVLKPINSLNITTSSNLPDVSNFLPGLSNISVTRFDRHEPDQSDALWSGAAVGLKQYNGDIGLGTAILRDYGAPKKVWAGSQLNIGEVRIFGDDTNHEINVGARVKNKQNAFVFTGDHGCTVNGSNNGDFLVGGAGNDVINGGTGDDYITGGAGNDILNGGAGNDIIYAGSGNCTLDGGAGSNVLAGGTGNNIFDWSSDGNNIMFGGTGNDIFDIKQGVKGNTQIKWERNFKNFGNDLVNIEGAIDKNSQVLFNFADEIRFRDMKWSTDGSDIIMTDHLGDKLAKVTFKNAFEAFSENSGQVDFRFTNGRLYADDETYHMRAGSFADASSDSNYKGDILVASSSGQNVLVAGKGNDLLFGGAGIDRFEFNDNFGNDTIISSDGKDAVYFNNVFDSSQFTLRQNNSNLVIGYMQKGLSTINQLTIENWFVSTNKVNDFAFGDGSHYTIKDNTFVQVS